jgi:hypothetical protein
MVRAANWAILEMLRLKPILKFTAPNAYEDESAFLIPEDALKGEDPVEVKIPSKYREAFVHGMAARCFGGDANNQADATRMAYEQQRFMELMKF